MTETYLLNNGLRLPVVGLGTFQIKLQDEIKIALDAALSCGYRLIDTAAVYKNEKHIGDCLPALLKKYGLQRSDIFLTTKLGPKDLDKASVLNALSKSLDNLQMDYVDLYLIHWPGKQGVKHDDVNNQTYRKEAWQEMENIFQNTDKVKAIGISNYTVKHLNELMAYCKVLPAVLQNEFHPDRLDKDVKQFCLDKGIHYQSYSSLGKNQLLTEDYYSRFSKIYNKTLSQVLLKWSIQHGCSIIPKSKNPEHIRENISIFDFTITDEDMGSIDKLGRGKKYGWNAEAIL